MTLVGYGNSHDGGDLNLLRLKANGVHHVLQKRNLREEDANLLGVYLDVTIVLG
jgi:hypothetical protein